MERQPHPRARQVIVGTDASGASTVVSDASSPETVLPGGIVLQELWQQRTLPARLDDLPAASWTLGPEAPDAGAVVRILTMPATEGDSRPAPDLHSDPSLHVITMLEGELDFVLETERVRLGAGETIVLRDSLHDLFNPHARQARFVYTSFPLTGGPSRPDVRD